MIAGFSAGAYGATNIALHHLGVFGSLQSWSGYYLETRSGVFAHASRPTLAYNSPLDYVRHARPGSSRPIRCARSCSSGATTTSSPQTRADGAGAARRAARASATRCIPAATTGSCGTRTSTRC